MERNKLRNIFLLTTVGATSLALNFSGVLPENGLFAVSKGSDDKNAPRSVPLPDYRTVVAGTSGESIAQQLPHLTPEAKTELTSTPTPTAIIKKKVNLFDKLIAPFVVEAEKREQEWKEFPKYRDLVDWELNKGRINFLVFGYGETYEPPFTKVVRIGSQTIFSYDSKRKALDLISWTHDIRAPEIERYWIERGRTAVRPIKIDQAYFTGGFDLQRRVGASISGLFPHYQLAFGDEVLVDLINDVFGKIKVEVPKDFQVNEFYFKDKKYPAAEFRKGVQELDGLAAIQFIKTVVIEKDSRRPDPELEHNARKPRVVAGIKRGYEEGKFNPLTWINTGRYLKKAVDNKQLATDFDSVSLLINHLLEIPAELVRSSFDGTEKTFMPRDGKNIYIVDKSHGVGGVMWLTEDPNPITKRDLARGWYVDPHMEVPYDGDPYAEDLVNNYWPSTRKRVKDILSSD